MTRNKMWFAAALLSAFTMSAYAGGDKMGGKSASDANVKSGAASASTSFSTADKDQNGAIDSSEAASISGLDFANADADQDGKLSRSEFEAAVGGSEKGAGQKGVDMTSPTGKANPSSESKPLSTP